MLHDQDFNHQVRRAAILSTGLGACLVFGIVVLASGDWLPGLIITVASTLGLARVIPMIRRFCSTPHPTPPRQHKTVE